LKGTASIRGYRQSPPIALRAPRGLTRKLRLVNPRRWVKFRVDAVSNRPFRIQLTPMSSAVPLPVYFIYLKNAVALRSGYYISKSTNFMMIFYIPISDFYHSE